MKVLVIIPAYNEEKNILKAVTDLTNTNSSIDYVIVNDGSKDNTKKVCINNNLNFIDLPNNLGIGGAVQTGYQYALKHDYDIAIQFDGDNQHDASFINNLIDEIKKGTDLVVGSRFVKELSEFKSTWIRRFGINFLSFLIKKCTGKRIYDPTSGFRAANKKVIEIFSNDYPIDYPEPDTIVKIIKKGYKVSEIPVKMKERINGKSSISFFKSIYYMIKVSISIIIASLNTRRDK